MRKLILISLVFLTSCSSYTYEHSCIVKEIHSRATTGYKYEYHIKGFPCDQIYYSDQEFKVGDTLKFAK